MAFDYDVVVIGSGFGGTMTALPIADRFKERAKNEKVLILERGTWWTTPVSTVQDKEVATYDFLKSNKQPVQFWSAVGTTRGLVDIFTRCYRTPRNPDGLYDFMPMGRKGLFGIFGRQADGVSVVRASGVGGGSLVYSNITVRPPDFVIDDWPVKWPKEERNRYYDLARNAIGVGVLWALRQRQSGQANASLISGKVTAYIPKTSITLTLANGDKKDFALTDATTVPGKLRIEEAAWIRLEGGKAREVIQQGPLRINTGLSNIATRSARLDPQWDPAAPPGVKRINAKPAVTNPPDPQPGDPAHGDWIDRARVFQTEISALTNDYGTVDSSINDLPTGDKPYDPAGSPKNYCERQGRCNVGCLPGARHTLNKQLMSAIYGKFDGTVPPTHKDQLSLFPLCEVDVIQALDGGGYRIDYLQRDPTDPTRGERRSTTAKRVVVAAGCLGTNELLLRCKERKTLPNLSDRVGEGFSTNGDYIGFLKKSKNWVSLVRGPVTTCYAHFNTTDPATGGDPSLFHIVEDQGIPPALAALVGVGVPFIRSLGKGYRNFLLLAWQILRIACRTLFGIFKNYKEEQDFFRSEDERTGRMMCIVAQGRAKAVGKFRLGRAGETPLRITRMDDPKKAFWQDPIYDAIDKTAQRLADRIAAEKGDGFFNPFIQKSVSALSPTAIGVPHPLGGCGMAETAAGGVVDGHGRVFNYPGLYVADAAVIPTALGVNPSLTISAVALRVVDGIIDEIAAEA